MLAIELAAQACRDLRLAARQNRRRRLESACGRRRGIWRRRNQDHCAGGPGRAKGHGLDVVGPLSGDTVFHYALRGDFDAVVAMYHDQGLAPLKAVAFDTGVNWTLGLPFIRTSPDHGTAYDIAGKGIANPSSMIAAIRLAKQLAKNRNDVAPASRGFSASRRMPTQKVTVLRGHSRLRRRHMDRSDQLANFRADVVAFHQ